MLVNRNLTPETVAYRHEARGCYDMVAAIKDGLIDVGVDLPLCARHASEGHLAVALFQLAQVKEMLGAISGMLAYEALNGCAP